MEAQVVPQLLHLHLHELFSLKGCGPEPLAEEAEAGPFPTWLEQVRQKLFLQSKQVCFLAMFAKWAPQALQLGSEPVGEGKELYPGLE